uniref:Family with sequence similarity 163 member B n=1 Tax=Rousettus aegyptiacus TaxID=9407 RepID=A0A7J8IJ16_ROUAE|nr:family with sequence similarity 163 member B [Rousettus aegyptiacus]
MTAGTVVITGGILATVILLCIIAVLCYCRLQEPEDGGVHNGGQRVAYHSLGADDLELPPGTFGGLQALNPNRLSAMREAFSRSRSVSTDV